MIFLLLLVLFFIIAGGLIALVIYLRNSNKKNINPNEIDDIGTQ